MSPRAPSESVSVLLVGGGHAHVEVLRRFALRPVPGLRLTVIAREQRTPYSGMLPGVIRGEFRPEAAQVDLAPLARAARARLIVAEARGIDLAAKRVTMRGQPAEAFDLLSLDVGGGPRIPPGTPPAHGVAVRPIGGFLAQLAGIEAQSAEGARIAVVGAGAGGTELALALARRFGGTRRIVLVGAGAEPLAGAPAMARRVVRAALADAGVETISGVTAEGIVDGRLRLSDGSAIAADATIWATGVTGPAFLARAGLACDDAGCVRVDRTLRSLSHPFVFAAGDCAAVAERALPKAGVFAVRAGPVLAGNLRRAIAGRKPRGWRPQRAALVLLGLGGGRAVGWRGGVAFAGDWVWRWKSWIDRRWLARYVPPAPPAKAASVRAE
jgi:selenide,water dikinase